MSAEYERATIRAEWPAEFDDGARCGFPGCPKLPMSRAAIRWGFTGGHSRAAMPGLPASTKAIATEPFSKRKWRKMIDRPHYLTAEEWGEACRLANNEAKPAKRAPRKSPGNGIAAGGARAGFIETRPEVLIERTMNRCRLHPASSRSRFHGSWRDWLARGKRHMHRRPARNRENHPRHEDGRDGLGG